MDHANVVLSSGTMDETHNGKYGTVDSPALVHVALDAGETLVLKGHFAGHGVQRGIAALKDFTLSPNYPQR